MLYIKKSSLFFNKSLFLQDIFSKNNFLAFFDFFSSNIISKLDLQLFMKNFNVNEFFIFFLQASFVKFFFKNVFFSFLSSNILVIKGNIKDLSKFFSFNLSLLNEFNLNFIGLFFNPFFVNSFFSNIKLLVFFSYDLSFLYKIFYGFVYFFLNFFLVYSWLIYVYFFRFNYYII